MSMMTDRLPAPAPAGPAPAGPAGLRPGDVDVWERWLPAWHVYNGVVLAVTTALAVTQGNLAGPELALVLAIGAGVVVLYWVAWIRSSLWDRGRRARIAYALVLLGVFTVLVAVQPAFTLLQFALYPQVFFALPPRLAIAAGLSIGLILAAVTLVEAGGDLAAASGEMILEVAMAAALTMLSAWIGAIIEQSAERQALLRQLAATRAELAAAEREAGTLEERARLSREIHDTLAQGFASVVTHLEAADATLDADPGRAREHVHAAEDVARASLADARGLVWALRPAALADGGLPAALERTAAGAAAAAGQSVDLTVSGTPRPLHPDVEVSVLRAAQEGLANARRHAGASRVTITLTYFDDEVALDVIDDGRGFDPAAIEAPGPGGGHGLRVMRERAERLGGRLEVESGPGEGTAIALALPASPPVGAEPAPPDVPAPPGVTAPAAASPGPAEARP